MPLSRYILLCAALAAVVVPLAGQNPGKSGNGKKGQTISKANAATLHAGKAVYNTYCGICHLNASTEKKVGPGLKGLGKREKFSTGIKVTDTSLREWIEKGGKDMPPFKETLSPEQIRDLIVYLKTL